MECGGSSGQASSVNSPTDINGGLPIPGAERPNVGAAPEDPEIVGDLTLPEGVSGDLEQVPGFDDLVTKYPDAVEVVRSSDLTSEDDFQQVYDELKKIHEQEGPDGLHQFMLSTGLLQNLGLDTIYTGLVINYEEGGGSRPVSLLLNVVLSTKRINSGSSSSLMRMILRWSNLLWTTLESRSLAQTGTRSKQESS